MAQSSHGHSHRRPKDHERGPAHYSNVDWEAKAAACQRELDEARARSVQMEKTMRWWSDCTTNWREKWTKVRNERNKAREEAKQYKVKVDILNKEINQLTTENNEFQQQLIEVKKDNEKLLSIEESKIVCSESPGDLVELRRKSPGYLSPNEAMRQRASLDSKFSNVDNALANKLSERRLKYDEVCKCLQNKNEIKSFLMEKIEKLTAQLHNTKMELTHSDRTLGSTESSHSEVERLQNELQDEVAAKQVLEEKIAELAMEVERLKVENNVQWSKREMLETENVAILKENKKLYSQVCELREQIHKLNRISDGPIYGVPLSNVNRLDSKFYLKKVSPNSRESSSNGSSPNFDQLEIKTISEDDDILVVEK